MKKQSYQDNNHYNDVPHNDNYTFFTLIFTDLLSNISTRTFRVAFELNSRKEVWMRWETHDRLQEPWDIPSSPALSFSYSLSWNPDPVDPTSRLRSWKSRRRRHLVSRLWSWPVDPWRREHMQRLVSEVHLDLFSSWHFSSLVWHLVCIVVDVVGVLVDAVL